MFAGHAQRESSSAKRWMGLCRIIYEQNSNEIGRKSVRSQYLNKLQRFSACGQNLLQTAILQNRNSSKRSSRVDRNRGILSASKTGSATCSAMTTDDFWEQECRNLSPKYGLE